MNVMRMEKGFKGAGELTNEVTLPEADVLRFARTDKDYLGRDKTLNARPALGLRLSGDRAGRRHDGHGGEAVLLDGAVVGSTASVAYGHTVGKILAFAYIKPEAAVPGTRLEVALSLDYLRGAGGHGGHGARGVRIRHPPVSGQARRRQRQRGGHSPAAAGARSRWPRTDRLWRLELRRQPAGRDPRRQGRGHP
jgi:hypothetical protein